MQESRTKTNFSEDGKIDYQRHQEKLKAMAAAPDKGKIVSADMMIQNLLKDSFKKRSPASVPVERADQFYSDLPHWLHCESTTVPSQYQQFWSLVSLTTELADTQKVSQLLLTSGLQVDVLGFIWSLANKVVPGQLTKQEFYIVLALVGLAQTGCTFNSLNVLKHIPVPSIPNLQCSLITNTFLRTNLPQSPDIPSCNSFCQSPNLSTPQLTIQKNKMDSSGQGIRSERDMNLRNGKQDTICLNENVVPYLVSGNRKYKGGGSSKLLNTSDQEGMQIHKEAVKDSTNFPYIGSSPTLEVEDDFSEFQSVPARTHDIFNNLIDARPDIISDDFTDFQSADVDSLDPFQTVVSTETKEIPKILFPKSFSEKFTNLKTNIIKISPESERKLKVLSTTESLSSLPESKISSSNKVSTSISVLGGCSRGVGSRLANHSFGSKPEKEKCYKYQKHKSVSDLSVNAEEILFGIKPICIENLMAKCHPKDSNNSNNSSVKDTKVKINDILKRSSNDENESISNFSIVSSNQNTRQIEIPMLGTFNETILPTQKKFSGFCTDLISVQEDKYSALRDINLILNQENNDSIEKNDEFGDFLSASVLPPASANSDPKSIPTTCAFLENDESKSWGDWNFNTYSKSNLNITPVKSTVENDSITKDVANVETEDLFDTLASLSVDEKNDISKYEHICSPGGQQRTVPSFERNNHVESCRMGNNLMFYDQSETKSTALLSKSDQLNRRADLEFWDFLSVEVKPSSEASSVSLTRQGSLPSLDLEISAVDETEQEVIWKKCLESCHNLIQEGFEKFNGIRKKTVLDEVFSAPKTRQYLNCLFIVYQISRRVSQNFSDPPSIQEELEKFWGRLQELCFEYNIKLSPSEEVSEDRSCQCSICLKYIVCDLINQGIYSYHPSCANLWINFVEKTLPFST